MSTERMEITTKLNSLFCPHGFEIYPFKIGWYNEQVDSPFKFDLHPDTLAYVVLSTPDMFELSLLPFMCRDDGSGHLDLLDKCMRYYFAQAKETQSFPDMEAIHDFELTPSRRPKVLVQPAGHVAGATYYYTRKSLYPDPFTENKKIFGVCMHPKYGGWFAIRGIFIFKSVQCPDLPRTEPIDCVPEQAKRAELLELFNFHWQDWRFRDIFKVEKAYSEDQKRYFATLPKDRKPLIHELREKYMKTHITAGKKEDKSDRQTRSDGENDKRKCDAPNQGDDSKSLGEFY